LFDQKKTNKGEGFRGDAVKRDEKGDTKASKKKGMRGTDRL